MGVKRREISAETAEMTRQLQVKSELERILTSPGFRTSKRSQEFLRYIVDTALDGRYDDLKERVIGIEVFQRNPDYDTGEHSIVTRVKANELRKRLAQFFAESDVPSSVQNYLPRGSLHPRISLATEVDQQEASVVILRKPASTPGHIKLRILASGLALALLVLGFWYFFPGRRANRIEGMFWNPIFQDSNQPCDMRRGPRRFWKAGYQVRCSGIQRCSSAICSICGTGSGLGPLCWLGRCTGIDRDIHFLCSSS